MAEKNVWIDEVAENLTRSIAGDLDSAKRLLARALPHMTPKFSYKVNEEYNENFEAMTADFAKVIRKYYK